MTDTPGPTVLVADDDDFVRDVLARHLARDGFRVELAPDGGQALDAIERAAALDLVLTDLRRPGASGLDVLRAAKKKWPAVPVIVMSAHADAATAREVMDAGALEFLEKPFSYGGAIAGRIKRAAGRA